MGGAAVPRRVCGERDAAAVRRPAAGASQDAVASGKRRRYKKTVTKVKTTTTSSKQIRLKSSELLLLLCWSRAVLAVHWPLVNQQYRLSDNGATVFIACQVET